MKKLNIGCGYNIMPEAVNLDAVHHDGVDVVFDLETCGLGNPLPFADNTFTHITAYHILEHIRSILPLMQELYRIATPDAILDARVPYVGNDMAFDDPQHIRQFGIYSWGFFGQPAYRRADYGYTADWRTQSTILVIPKELAKMASSREDAEHLALHGRNFVTEMQATLIAVKPARDRLAPEDKPTMTLKVQP